MTHDQIVAALRRGYQLDDARDSRRGCYPIRKPAPRTKSGGWATHRSLPVSRTRPGSATLRDLRRWNREHPLALLGALLGAIGVATILAIGNLAVETAKHVL